MRTLHAGTRAALFFFPLSCCFGGLPGASAMALDPAGNIWLAGSTTSAITVTPNALQPNLVVSTCGDFRVPPGIHYPIPCHDAFVIKLDPAGAGVLYATYLGGSGDDVAIALAVDAAGSVYVTGYTSSPDFPTTPGAFQPKNAGPYADPNHPSAFAPVPSGDAFVVKLNADGSLAYSTCLGGSRDEAPAAIQVDHAGAAYVAGSTSSPDFPLTAAALDPAPGASFIAKLNPAGSALAYSTYWNTRLSAFTVDPGGAAYLAGDHFIAKIDAAGAIVLYNTDLGTSSVAIAIAVDSRGAAWAGGGTLVTSYPETGTGAALLWKLAPDTGKLVTTVPFPGRQTHYIGYVAVDAHDDVYGSGELLPVNFPATPTAVLDQPCSSYGGTFLAEADSSGRLLYASFLRRWPIKSGIAVEAPGRVAIVSGVDQSLAILDLTTAPAANFQCPLNAASFAVGGIVPGEIVSIFGRGLGPETGAVAQLGPDGRFPTALAGVQVLFNGTPAPLLYAGSRQVNAVVPRALASPVTVGMVVNAQALPPMDVTSQYEAAGIFGVLNQDNSLNSAARPARAGSTLQVFATGLNVSGIQLSDGGITPLPPPFVPLGFAPLVSIGGVPASVAWSGAAPGLIFGVEQINVEVPPNMAPGAVSLAVAGSPPFLVSVAP